MFTRFDVRSPCDLFCVIGVILHFGFVGRILFLILSVLGILLFIEARLIHNMKNLYEWLSDQQFQKDCPRGCFIYIIYTTPTSSIFI